MFVWWFSIFSPVVIVNARNFSTMSVILDVLLFLFFSMPCNTCWTYSIRRKRHPRISGINHTTEANKKQRTGACCASTWELAIMVAVYCRTTAFLFCWPFPGGVLYEVFFVLRSSFFDFFVLHVFCTRRLFGFTSILCDGLYYICFVRRMTWCGFVLCTVLGTLFPAHFIAGTENCRMTCEIWEGRTNTVRTTVDIDGLSFDQTGSRVRPQIVAQQPQYNQDHCAKCSCEYILYWFILIMTSRPSFRRSKDIYIPDYDVINIMRFSVFCFFVF